MERACKMNIIFCGIDFDWCEAVGLGQGYIVCVKLRFIIKCWLHYGDDGFLISTRFLVTDVFVPHKKLIKTVCSMAQRSVHECLSIFNCTWFQLKIGRKRKNWKAFTEFQFDCSALHLNRNKIYLKSRDVRCIAMRCVESFLVEWQP